MSFPARFETYELFRIILPGFFFMSLLCVSAYLFLPIRSAFIEFFKHPAFLFVVVVGGIFLGFVLYAYDHPKRIKAYRGLESEMPSTHLKNILCDSCSAPCDNKIHDKGSAIDTYFYLLGNLFDSASRERVLYIGSVYHVLSDIRMLSSVFGSVILLISVFGLVQRAGLPIIDAIFGLAFGFALLFFWLWLHPEFFCKKQLSKGDKYLKYILKFQRRYLDLEIEKIRRMLCKQKRPIQ